MASIRDAYNILRDKASQAAERVAGGLRSGAAAAEPYVQKAATLFGDDAPKGPNPNVGTGRPSAEARAFQASQNTPATAATSTAKTGLRTAGTGLLKKAGIWGTIGSIAVPPAMAVGGAITEKIMGGSDALKELETSPNKSLIPDAEAERLTAKYAPQKGLRDGGGTAPVGSPIDNAQVPVKPGTGVVRNNQTGRETRLSAADYDQAQGFTPGQASSSGLRKPDGIFGFMAGNAALQAKAKGELNDEARQDNATRLGLRQQATNIAAAKVVQDERRLNQEAGFKNEDALDKTITSSFITQDADGKQIEDKAGKADFLRAAQFTLAQQAKRTGQQPRNLRQLAPEELQDLLTLYKTKQAAVKSRGDMSFPMPEGVRDYFGSNRVDSDDLSQYMPESVEPGFLGDRVTLKSGENRSVSGLRGGGFNWFTPNDPVNADIDSLINRKRKE